MNAVTSRAPSRAGNLPTRVGVLSAAQRQSGSSTKPGGPLPYGAAQLPDRYVLEWISPPTSPGAMERCRRRVDGISRRLMPGRRGAAVARVAGDRLAKAQVVLSIFEDAGLDFARIAPAGSVTPPHVMIVCWLAQDIAEYGRRATRSVQASMASLAAVCVYSSNQVAPLARALGLPIERFHVVPFGVDTDYFDRQHASGDAGGGGIVAVGSDSRRDYATLFAASALTGQKITVSCHPRNLRGLVVPPTVRLVSVFDSAYRDLLHHADLVVTPTTAPAYPSGQSVVLEAMSMGRATLTTDSPAMREYVDAEETGLLTPPRDPRAMATSIDRAVSDRAFRDRLGDAAATAVRERFTFDTQWASVARVIEEVSR